MTRRFFWVYLLPVWLACSPHSSPRSQTLDSDSDGHGGTNDGIVPVELGSCPEEREPTVNKIAGAATFDANPDLEYPVAVWLRAASLPPVPSCPEDDGQDSRCMTRDNALMARQALNAQELNCVLDSLAARITHLSALWYELPYHLTSGAPVPIGLSFRLTLTGAQIAELAAHPFIEKIEPAPGTTPGTNLPAPSAPAECRTGMDDPTPKLDQLTQIQGKGFQPTLIDLDVSERNLPDYLPCEDDTCTADWDRTILNTREITCVQRRIDAVVSEHSPPLTILGSMVPGPMANLPPFGQALAVTLVLGQGFTWDEAVLVAADPAVGDIRTYDGLSFDPPPPIGCPPDLTAAIPIIACTDERESIDGKIDAARLPELEAATSPIDVDIMVSGGAPSCPEAACSTPPCADSSEPPSWMSAMNMASQYCVRDLITSLGGASNPEVNWLVDSFEASLTWEQIQAVAAYPTVTQVVPDSSPLN